MTKVLQALSDKASSSQTGEPNSQAFSHFAGISPPCSFVNYGFSFYKDCVIDTGASDHMTSNASILHNVIDLPQPLFVALPDGTLKPVYKTRTLYLTKYIVLYDVLLIPDFKPNLLSVGKLISRSKLLVTFSDNNCLFQDPSSNTTITVGKRTRDLYTLRISVTSKACNTTSLNTSNVVQQINVALFHSILGHSSAEKLKHVNPIMMQRVNKMFCETCVLVKHHSLPFHISLSHATKCFDLVHMDLWGPYKQSDRTVYDELRVFGSLCYATRPVTVRDKFMPKARKCLFIGYPPAKKCYKLYDLETHDVFVNRDVVFYEHYFPFKTTNIQQFSTDFISDIDIIKESSSTSTYNIAGPTNQTSIPSPGPLDVRRSSRTRKTSSRLSGYHCPSISTALHTAVIQQLDNFDSTYISLLSNVIKEIEPSYYNQASKDFR
ncbi:uncharacterized protein LOC141641088 [Silene latifolia]|uniref:uncharacterized protein LOC141641088 n=1 Tax=Silene latifolia TaxID=37657 RepID=UPI003D77081E